MINISIKKWKEANVRELAEFVVNIQQAEGRIQQENNIIDRIEDNLSMMGSYISHVVLAHFRKKLVGWLSLNTLMSSMAILDEWDPLVLPGREEEIIASKLLEKSLDFTRKLGRKNLRVFLGEITETEEMKTRLQ
ncbi:MAG: hypothetical protein ACFFBD_09125, partial [Candidatus Hodarchaeota archaeon]